MLRDLMSHKQMWDAIAAEIQRRKDAGETFAALNKAIGEKENSTKAFKIYHAQTTGERINLDKTKQYMKGLGLKFDEPKQAATSHLEGFGLVCKVKARLGAGSSLMTEDDTEGLFAFRDDFLRALGLNAKPVLFGVVGDSMEPTLKNGDTVLVDKADQEIQSGLLYGVGVGEELHIKRVFKQPDGTILLKSDNPNFPSWEVPKDERPRIIGRARWVGRLL